MSLLQRVRREARGTDFLQSAVEFLLGAGFLALAVGLWVRSPLVMDWGPDPGLWVVYELGAAFIMGLAHFVTYDDDRLPLWSRIVFVATMGGYVIFILRHAWPIVLPLLGAKAFSLWLHGTLTDEAFSYRVLKGMYLFGCLVIGLVSFTVLDMLGAWPHRSEPPWPLAAMIAVYYLGLGLWEVVLACIKRMPDAPAGG